ncbi:hypothetical protein BDW68DRAFT_198895 [Aspergillus falconensis]
MSDATFERLNRLQEADLGTARREEISTADCGFDVRLTRLEVIEASRRSNVPGTIEQQIAHSNRDRLDAWTKHLDNLLDGQSHRLRLKDELRKGNTHDQRPPDRCQRAFRVPTQNIPVINNGRTQNQAVPHGTSSSLVRSDAQSSSSSVYSQNISSPEEFLAEARSVTSRRGPEQEPLIQTPKADVLAKATDRRGENSCLTLMSPNVVKLKEQKDSTQLVAFPAPEDKVESTGHDLGAGSVSTDSPEETPPAASINTTDQAKTEKLDRNPQEPVITRADSTPASRPQRAVGILVDLDSAMESGAAAAMSPALQELEGLDFTQSPGQQSSRSSPLASANRRLDFGGISHEEQQMSSELDNPKATTDAEDEELAEEYRREIDIICQLLERTHLSDTFFSKLTECKEELEARLRQRRDANLETPQSQQVLTPSAPKLEKPEIATPAKALAAVAPEPKETEDVSSAVVENTPTHSRHTSTSRVSAPSSLSPLNARASQFTPKSSLEHQSLSDATFDSSISLRSIPSEVVSASQPESALSEDTAVPATVGTPLPEPQPALIPTFAPIVREASGTGQLFGDHLLPGSRYRQPGQSHLYGDLLLPGRRATPTTITKPTVPETTESVLAKAAALKPAPTTFSIPPPSKPVQTVPKPSPATFAIPPPSKPAKLIDLNSLVNGKAKFSNAASAAVSAPSTTLKTTQKMTSMMESIYAPKPNVVSSSTINVKTGLSASRYSDPKWL